MKVSTQEKEIETTWRQCGQCFPLTSASTEKVVKMFLLEVVGTVWKELCSRLQKQVVDRQMSQLYTEKHGGEMMLEVVLVRSINYGKNRNRELQGGMMQWYD